VNVAGEKRGVSEKVGERKVKFFVCVSGGGE